MSKYDNEFKEAIVFIIDELEGGDTILVDDDGITKYGICSKYHPNVDVRNLSEEQAIQIYDDEYRMNSHFDDNCRERGFEYALFLLDVSINMSWAFPQFNIFQSIDSLFLKRMFLYLRLANTKESERKNLRGWMNRCLLLYNHIWKKYLM